MRVLHIVNYSLDRPNGIKTVIERLVPLQNKNGIKAEVYNINYTKGNEELLEYDLIVFHGVYEIKYLKLYSKIKKIPYIIVPHCSFTKESLKKSRLKKKLFNLLANNFYKNSRAIGFLNLEEKDVSIKVNKNFVILPNGIKLPSNFQKIEKDIESSLQIIYLSRIDIYHKGLDLLVKAVIEIKDILIKEKVTINIYGNAFYEKNLDFLKKEIKDKNLQEIFKYKGKVEGIEKEKALEKSDLFILTSRFEGFPMAVLEALSYGLPCILTKGTNMGTMIEDYKSGWICETKVEDISKVILKAIKEFKTQKNNYRDNALKNARDYEWEKIVDYHITEYKKILKMEKL